MNFTGRINPGVLQLCLVVIFNYIGKRQNKQSLDLKESN